MTSTDTFSSDGHQVKLECQLEGWMHFTFSNSYSNQRQIHKDGGPYLGTR